MFDGGTRLFPEDPLAAISHKIQKYEKPIDESIVDRIIEHWRSVEYGIKNPIEVKSHLAESYGFGDTPNYVEKSGISSEIQTSLEKRFKRELLEVYVSDENGNIERLRVEH